MLMQAEKYESGFMESRRVPTIRRPAVATRISTDAHATRSFRRIRPRLVDDRRVDRRDRRAERAGAAPGPGAHACRPGGRAVHRVRLAADPAGRVRARRRGAGYAGAAAGAALRWCGFPLPV